MINELKSINRWHDEDHEECRTFRKKYKIDREERKGSDNTSFSENIRSLIQQITKNAICTISKIARKQTNRTPYKPSPNIVDVIIQPEAIKQ